MTLHLEPVPGGLLDNDANRAILTDPAVREVLMSADNATVVQATRHSLRADVLVVAEEEAGCLR